MPIIVRLTQALDPLKDNDALNRRKLALSYAVMFAMAFPGLIMVAAFNLRALLPVLLSVAGAMILYVARADLKRAWSIQEVRSNILLCGSISAVVFGIGEFNRTSDSAYMFVFMFFIAPWMVVLIFVGRSMQSQLNSLIR